MLAETLAHVIIIASYIINIINAKTFILTTLLLYLICYDWHVIALFTIIC